MKSFKTLKASLDESKKMKVKGIAIEIVKVKNKFQAKVDGDVLDTYASEKEAEQEEAKKAAAAKKVIPMDLSLIQTKQSILLVKNEAASIWKNLWLPFESKLLKNYIQNFKLTSAQEIRHELTHRRLDLRLKIYLSSKESQINTNQQYKWIKKDRIDEYGLPKPISKAIKQL